VDELLYDRVKQLKELDNRLERIEKMVGGFGYANVAPIAKALGSLRLDLALMIQQAEQAHADF
jgi:hypothetical protein